VAVHHHRALPPRFQLAEACLYLAQRNQRHPRPPRRSAGRCPPGACAAPRCRTREGTNGGDSARTVPVAEAERARPYKDPTRQTASRPGLSNGELVSLAGSPGSPPSGYMSSPASSGAGFTTTL
jgi:hypothetical protein